MRLSDRRIPISLKVPEDEFFYDFIEPKRISKELSPFIYQILRAFYEDEVVKAAVKPHLTVQNEDKLAFLNAELNRVAMEHSATIMETQVLQDEIEDKKHEILTAVQETYGPTEEHSEQEGTTNKQELLSLPSNSGVPSRSREQVSQDNTEISELKGRMDKMESKVDGMDSNISAILNLLQGRQTVATQEVKEVQTEPVKQPEVSVSQEPVNKPLMEEPVNTGVSGSVEESKSSVETTNVEKTAEGEQVGKVSPAFNKLMGSLHKF